MREKRDGKISAGAQTQVPAASQKKFTTLIGSLFLMGLSQAMLGLGRNFIDSQRPIDWAHWLALVGAVGVAVSIAQMRAGPIGKVARVLVVAGAIAFVGMVAIDVLLWTIEEDPIVDAALDEALDSPGVAIPFLWVGPSLLFIGLALKALEWWKASAPGAALLILGTLICGFGQSIPHRWTVVGGFIVMLVGLVVVSLGYRSKKE
jgi:hypothetical protein